VSDSTLNTFRKLVSRFAEHQEFIVRAKGLARDYTPGVVDRVIRDHRVAIDTILPDLVTAFAEAEEVVRELKSLRDEALAQAEQAREEAQLFELRALIGELDGEVAELSAAPHRERAAAVQPTVDFLQGRLDGYRDVLREWYRVGVASGVLRSDAPRLAIAG
jgi:hypothetical protein